MKKLIFILFLTYNLNANVGKVTSYIGEVSIIRDNIQKNVEKNMILLLNDTIQTKDNSKALILMNDDTSINIGKKSSISINEFVYDEKIKNNSHAKFSFGNGLFRTITGKIGKLNPNGFRIKTKTASIGIRGTVFDVVVKENITKVGVIEGGIYFINDKTNQQFEVKVGQKLIDDSQETNIIEGPVEESKELDSQEQNNFRIKKDKPQEKESQEKESQEDKTITQKKDEKIQEDKNPLTQKQEEPKEDEVQNQSSVIEEELIEEEVIKITEESEEKIEKIEIVVVPLTIENPIEVVAEVVAEVTEEVKEKEKKEKVEEIINEKEKVEEIINEKETITNNSPTIVIESNVTTPKNETIQINFTTNDIDNDELTIASTQANDGTVEIENSTVKYTPNQNFYGTDTFTITVTDTAGNSSAELITITVYQNPIDSVPNNIETIDSLTKEILKEDTYTYMQFGYLKNDSDERTDVFVTGSLTPIELIENYIIQESTASYSGNIASIITDINNNVTTDTEGTINLNFNFANKSFDGSLNINETWNATINSGTVNSNSFTSSDISKSNSDITGDINGNFYGSNADNVGGNINLNSQTQGSVKATFGGVKNGTTSQTAN